MKFRHKSASLDVDVDPHGSMVICNLISQRVGRGHAGALLRGVTAMLAAETVCLHVEPFAGKHMPKDALFNFYSRVGFVRDDRSGLTDWMWIYP